jgi:hypothetical protein
MGMAAHPQRRSRAKVRVGLPKIGPRLPRWFHALIARLLLKPGVLLMGDILLDLT